MARPTLKELRAVVQAGPPYEASFLAALRDDTRAGAQALYAECVHDQAGPRMDFEREALANGFQRVAGVDEVGRGPLAGPIVAAAVVLAGMVPGLNDSKQLRAAQRLELYEVLHQGGHSIGVGLIEVEFIDRFGIQSANYAAMAQAVGRLEPAPDFLLVDGFQIRGCPLPQKPLVKGDCRSASIAAASIVAKVVRDGIMEDLDRQYAGYGFASNKGYGTAEHLEALRRLGPCPVHRRSFAPVAEPDASGWLFT